MKRVLALLLAIVFCVSLAGCGNAASDFSEKKVSPSGTAQTTKKSSDENPVFDETSTAEIKAEKLTSSSNDISEIEEGGIVYKDQNKYGIMSFDGKSDTGLKYLAVVPKEQYFAVVEEAPADDADSIQSMNIFGLVDATGKVLVPFQYAGIDVVNEHFARVIEVSDTTENEDEGLLFASASRFGMFYDADNGDVLYKGKWYIYNLDTGKKLEGAEGTENTNYTGHGKYITYYNAQGNKVTVNVDNKPLPDDAELIGDVSQKKDSAYAYLLDTGDTTTVYDTSDQKLFSYKSSDFEVKVIEDGYFSAAQYGDTNKYFYLDRTGKKISADFKEFTSFLGGLVKSDDVLYKLDGTKVIDYQADAIRFDEFTRSHWAINKGDQYTFINNKGDVLFKGTESDTVTVDYTSFGIKDTDKQKAYSFADKDYTLNGGFLPLPFAAEVQNNAGKTDLQETLANKTLISNYDDYDYSPLVEGVYYVAASKDEGGFDVYKVYTVRS